MKKLKDNLFSSSISLTNDKLEKKAFNTQSNAQIQRMRKQYIQDYKKHSNLGIEEFEKYCIHLVAEHLSTTDYKNHKLLIREIKFFVYSLFNLLKDDYYKGNKFFEKQMTKIDDYIFSKYVENEQLKENIQKIKILAWSDRFDENPRKNILSYFVFLEETGFEIIELLNDYYSMLSETKNKNIIEKIKALFTKKSKKQFNSYIKPDMTIDNTKEIFAPLTKQTVAYKPTVMAKRNLLNQIILEFELKE